LSRPTHSSIFFDSKRRAGARRANLSTLTGEPLCARELEWFFNQADCDVGMRSNFLRVLGVEGEGDEPSMEAKAEAAHAQRRIRRWLRSIPDRDAGVLQCAYTNRPWPAKLQGELGRLTGVVARLACAAEAVGIDAVSLEKLEDVRAAWLAEQCGADVRWRWSPFEKLRLAADRRLTKARLAYAAARGSGPCIVRPW
jgi:hypothetical protein